MSARSRAQPWFAPTGQEATERWWKTWHDAGDQRERRDAEEALFDEWMSGGNPTVDMVTAERMFARKAAHLSAFAPPWERDADGFVSVRDLVRAEIRREVLGR